MRITLALLIFLVNTTAAAASESCPEGLSRIVFADISVIPMTDDVTVAEHATVLVCGEWIVRVGPKADVAVPEGARIVDGRGKWLMPGLRDMHVHLEHVEDPDFLKLFLAWGVTTVRSMDGRPFILAWRDAVEAGRIDGPRIITAGPIIDGTPPLRDDNLSVADAGAGRRTVRQQAAAGYDFVKVYDRLGREAWAAVVAEAGIRGLRVAGHIPDAVPIGDIIGKHWSIEHITSFAAAVGTADGDPLPRWARELYLASPPEAERVDALAASLSASGVWVVPTLIERDRSAGDADDVRRWREEPGIADLPEWIRTAWRQQNARITARLDEGDRALIAGSRRNRVSLLARLHAAGVNIAAGTDTPNPFVAPGAALHRELAIYVEAGLTRGEALATATSAAARMLADEAETGRIEEGARADLMLLSANPLADIAALSRIVGVHANGRWYDEKALKAFRRSLAEPQGPGDSSAEEGRAAER